MATQIVDLECPGCGYPINTGTQKCPKCKRDIVISTFNSVASLTMPEINKTANTYRKALAGSPDNKDLNMSLAFCYLKLKLYDKAIPCFEKAVEDNFDNSETFFYLAVSLLKGKKAFLTPRTEINKAEEYIQAACMIEPRGIYYYFQAYLRYDHHFRKGYMVKPSYKELLAEAGNAGYSAEDVKQLFAILGVDKPDAL